MQFTPSSRTGDQSFWPEDHHRDENDAKDQVTNIAERETRRDMGQNLKDGIQNRGQSARRIGDYCIELREDNLITRGDHERSNDHTGHTAYTTNHYHSQVDHRDDEA